MNKVSSLANIAIMTAIFVFSLSLFIINLHADKSGGAKKTVTVEEVKENSDDETVEIYGADENNQLPSDENMKPDEGVPAEDNIEMQPDCVGDCMGENQNPDMAEPELMPEVEPEPIESNPETDYVDNPDMSYDIKEKKRMVKEKKMKGGKKPYKEAY